MSKGAFSTDETIVLLVGLLSFLALAPYRHFVAKLRRERPEILPDVYGLACFQLAGLSILLTVFAGQSALLVLSGFLSAILLSLGVYLLWKHIWRKSDAAWARSDKEEGTRQMRIFAIEDATAAKNKRRRIDL